MKKKGHKCDYIQERNANLRREFFERLGRNGRSLTQVFDDLSKIKADRFYISEERAHRLIAEERKYPEDHPAAHFRNRRSNKSEMLSKIKSLTELYMREHPGVTLKDAVFEVVNSPAPSFYLTRATIRTIIYEILNRS